MKQRNFYTLIASLMLALSGWTCFLPSVTIEVVEVIAPPPNGEVVFFEIGEEKYFSDGEFFTIMQYDGERNWYCSDTASGQICDAFESIVGVGDPEEPNAIHLLGVWHEVEAEEIPAPPQFKEEGI